MSKEQHKAPQKPKSSFGPLVKSPAYEDLREILLGGLVPRESGGGERVREVEVIGRSDNHHKDLKIEIPLSLNPVVHLGEE